MCLEAHNGRQSMHLMQPHKHYPILTLEHQKARESVSQKSIFQLQVMARWVGPVNKI